MHAIDVSGLPEHRRKNYQSFADLLSTIAGKNLLGLCAFGGWAVDDPWFATTRAQSVAILGEVELGGYSLPRRSVATNIPRVSSRIETVPNMINIVFSACQLSSLLPSLATEAKKRCM